MLCLRYTFFNKGNVTSSELKMRGRRMVVPELARNVDLTCHSGGSQWRGGGGGWGL